MSRENLRELSAEAIKAVIRSPDTKTKLRPGQHKGMVFAFEKPIGQTTLKVIAEIRDQDVWNVTAYEKD
ncbi:MAG: hypothetical protein HC901_02020 [Bdellovibrionaceae bacterium]|nr:hypothetical protein [Pseudobdellovibrionaceae bacterium]